MPASAGMFLFLWLFMLREKNSTLSIVAAALAMLASMKVAYP
jgi:hypothetical protein